MYIKKNRRSEKKRDRERIIDTLKYQEQGIGSYLETEKKKLI